jgi:arginase family enzyme
MTLFGVAQAHPGPYASVLGLPFDMGTHPTRVGARTGPAHIRAHSAMVAEHGRDFRPAGFEGVIDLGDLALRPGDVRFSYPVIEAAVDAIEGMPITLGGDGAVTLPVLRSVARKHPGLVVVHVDAHTDAYGEGAEFTNANPFVHAVREGLVDVGHSFQAGLRWTPRIQQAADLGYELMTVEELDPARIVATVGDRPLYVCWDMDVFDPSITPGVVTPAWGGITVREGLALIHALRGLNVVALDVNALSPPHDIGGQTGSLAAHVILEFLTTG